MQLKAWMTEQAVRRLLAASGHDLDALVASARSRNFRPVTLGIRTSLRFKATLARTQSANVLGLLPGSDPKLAAEVVIYSAHHDHLGIAAPDANGAKAQADRIYNGAVDNAAGCAQLLAIARAMAGLPQRPKRSILMIFAAAEEQGLLGSLYYSRHPTFPPGKIAADFNYDGGNIWGATRDVPVVGYGRSTLDGMLTAAAAFQNRLVTPEQDQDRGYFYRSDEFSFATIGAPAIALNTGTDFIGRPPGWGQQQKDQWDEVRYHQPSDELDSSWNFDGMIQNAQLGYYAGWLVAQSAELPQWNRGDEFEDERLRAVAAQGSRTQ
jgi:Zn-dependent M28 family amino/carboxypeptidase